MRKSRVMRTVKLFVSGAFLMQFVGCSFVEVNEFIQTVLLGVTAAGSVAILQNI